MNILKYKECANCGACYNQCPTKAIYIEENKIHYTLKIKEDKCIQCGICLSVCPVNQEKEKFPPQLAYGAWHKNADIIMQSSSGGIFYGLAKKILDNSGIVYGAAFSKDYKSVNICSTDEVALDELMKSKYVESLVNDSFIDVRNKLAEGRMVLFSGTPCQIQGLKRFLKKDYDNLLCCDFACGGLPSHKMYTEHLEKLEKKYKSKVDSVDFRPKTHGWNRYAIWIKFKNGKIYNRLAILDDYYRAFLYGKYSVRDYCINCSFSENHVSDITMADFWKYATMSSLNNPLGISLVICNTHKGQRFLDSIKEEYQMELLNIKDASYNLQREREEEYQKDRRKQFLEDYKISGLHNAVNKYIKLSSKKRLKLEIVNIINRRKKWDKEN